MERYSVFLSRKNQYCENDYTTKCKVHRFSFISIKLPVPFFTELEQKFHNSCGNTKDPNSQSSLEKEQ